jgi:hypothetical protein
MFQVAMTEKIRRIKAAEYFEQNFSEYVKNSSAQRRAFAFQAYSP